MKSYQILYAMSGIFCTRLISAQTVITGMLLLVGGLQLLNADQVVQGFRRFLLEDGIVVRASRDAAAGAKFVWSLEIFDPKKRDMISNISLVVRKSDSEGVCCVTLAPYVRDIEKTSKAIVYRVEIFEDYLQESSIGINLKSSKSKTKTNNLDFMLSSLLSQGENHPDDPEEESQ